MTSLTNFSPWHPHANLTHFPVTHWLLNYGNCISSSPIGHQTIWLIIIFCQLIIIPGSHSLACLCDDKITHYIDKTLFDFVEIYLSTHCYTVSILSLYFHVHILCTFCTASSTYRLFMLIIVRSIRQWTTTTSM